MPSLDDLEISLGFRRVGRHDLDYDILPFHLLSGSVKERAGRPRFVDINPRVALWPWCREERIKGATWTNKRYPTIRHEMSRYTRMPLNADQFDAAVGYILGFAYLCEYTNRPLPL